MRLLLVVCCLLAGCAPRQRGGEVRVAAAANLQKAMESLSKAFEKKTGAKTVVSYGASTSLAQQIENGGPFDLFLSADTAQVKRLAAKGLIEDGSQAVYARGVLALWAAKRTDITKLEDLDRADVKRIAVANPELAPYGKAAIEAMTAAGLWPKLEPKVVYGPNISIVAQFADSANADAAFTAYSLVNDRLEKPIVVPDSLYQPIEQGLGIVKGSAHKAAAEEFRRFLLGRDGQAVLATFGYKNPK